MTVDIQKFKTLMSNYCSGVSIITINKNGQAHGLTVASFTSVSLEPPLILFCRKTTTRNYSSLDVGDDFVVNVLCEKQEKEAMQFANPKLDSKARFDGIATTYNHKQIPVLEGNLFHLNCQVVNAYSEGDHIIYIGKVEGGNYDQEMNPLLYFQRGFRSIFKESSVM